MSSRVKALYVINTTTMGGGNISFINLVRELKKKGIDIYIAYPNESMDSMFYGATKDFVSDYFRVHLNAQYRPISHQSIIEEIKKNWKLWLIHYSSLVRSILMRREIEQLKTIIRQNHIDIVHTNVGVIHSGFFAAKEMRIPHIWHIREYQTKDFNCEILPSRARFEGYLKKSYVITITEDLKNYFALQDEPHAKCIYNGCFSEKDTAFDFPKHKYFLCCSRISPEKGIDEAIRAFSLFYHCDSKNTVFRLIIAGLGNEEYVNEIKKTARLCKIDSVTEFTGFKEDVRPLMDHAAALIVASKFEGFGRMTAEAAFRGCLVIGKDAGGTSEILNQTGGYLYSGDSRELAEQMIRVSELTEGQYMAIACEAQRVAIERFSNEQSAKRVFELYQEALRKS